MAAPSSPSPLVERVRAISARFHPGQEVSIRATGVRDVAQAIVDFTAHYKREAPAAPPTGAELLGDLFFGAINYCYWYGVANFTPAGGGATTALALIRKTLSPLCGLSPEIVARAGQDVIRALSLAGFPLAERRAQHIAEISSRPADTVLFLKRIRAGELSAPEILERLVTLYPGFASDPLLKRALLFVHLLHRCHGLLPAEQIAGLPVAADYQLPKLLVHFGALHYTPELRAAIDCGDLIQEGSRREIEIRAATIIACDQIAEIAGVSPEFVDEYLWVRRKGVSRPYHLTITTHY